MRRLTKLKKLEKRLFEEMQTAPSKDVASIARQYRETLKEIEELEGDNGAKDEIGDILGK